MKQQDTYILHKPVCYRFNRNRVIVGGIDKEWEADLVMDSLSKENTSYKYILTVIDLFSKYAWVEPLKTKSGENFGNPGSFILTGGLSSRINTFKHF